MPVEEVKLSVDDVGKMTSLDTSAEFTVDNGESDEDELSELAREDLIRDTLSNTGIVTCR